MPTQEAHVKAANANRKTLDFLTERVEDHSRWVVTVAFYTALHVVEAVLAQDGIHQDDHKRRHHYLKSNRKYQHIWKHYQPLFNDSLVARYLTCDESGVTFSDFSQYMSPDDIVQQHIKHHLKQIILSASSLANAPSILATLTHDSSALGDS